MPVFLLDHEIRFPQPHLADAQGLLAIGGDLRPERLLLAYRHGIFPWPHEDYPLMWHSPDPRFVLSPAVLAVPRSLRQRIYRRPYRLSMDTAFARVIEACARVPRPEQGGTWILPEMVQAYIELHEMGYAHSVEAWEEERLVGGLYGIGVGNAFCGESMFALRPDASKVAFALFVREMGAWGMDFIDCQVYTEHLARFGATHWPRAVFLERLGRARLGPERRGRWCFEGDPYDHCPRPVS